MGVRAAVRISCLAVVYLRWVGEKAKRFSLIKSNYPTPFESPRFILKGRLREGESGYEFTTRLFNPRENISTRPAFKIFLKYILREPDINVHDESINI